MWKCSQMMLLSVNIIPEFKSLTVCVLTEKRALFSSYLLRFSVNINKLNDFINVLLISVWSQQITGFRTSCELTIHSMDEL